MANQTATVKGVLTALAIVLFGMGMAILSAGYLYASIGVFLVVGIVGFFAILADIPKADLPADLQSLRTLLSYISVSRLEKVLAFIETNQGAIDKFLEELSTANLEQLLSLLQGILTAIQAQNAGVGKPDVQL